jgi:hypothetical protein
MRYAGIDPEIALSSRRWVILRSQVPDLVHGPRSRSTAASCSRLDVGRRERGPAPPRLFDRTQDNRGLRSRGRVSRGEGQGARAGIDLHLASTWQLQLSHRAVRASSDEQRTGYELGVAIVQTAEGRSHDVKVNHMTL